jgi:hypothetical protein
MKYWDSSSEWSSWAVSGPPGEAGRQDVTNRPSSRVRPQDTDDTRRSQDQDLEGHSTGG